jgi:prepilin-type N-terminal cleavage/methylation domain-containing protein
MLEKLRQRSSEESGFTLVELLVVMLILGILAAIAIPTFFNQRDKARDASAKEAVRTAQTAMETYGTDHNGDLTGADAAALKSIEPTLPTPGAASFVATPGAGGAYEISVWSSTGTKFTITRAANSAGGATTFSCDKPGEGGCPSPDGNWGA